MGGGHGYVRPRADGSIARCGGPPGCAICVMESTTPEPYPDCALCGSLVYVKTCKECVSTYNAMRYRRKHAPRSDA